MIALFVLALAAAQPAPAPPPVPVSTDEDFRWSGEFKLHFRSTPDLESPIFTPFPGPPREVTPTQRSADAGESLELSSVNVRGEGDLVSGVRAKVEVHVLDLYNRNPTSSDDRIFVREAWLRFGDAPELMRPATGSRVFGQVGLAPRFTKQIVRRLDSYGMWGTAVSRFEQPQLQVGANLGHHVYLRAQVGNGNPVFLRDTNALAGDNGTPERFPGSPLRVYETGFPILYDAKPADINFSSRMEWGWGAGARWGDGEARGIDVLGWHFRRRMEDAAHIRGTALRGDLDILRGEGFPLPFEGDRKSETGINVHARWRQWRLFGQLVDQDIAGLGRRGYEVELAWVRRLHGLVLLKESPVFNWVQPVVRVSYIDNLFDGPFRYPSLSVDWDWLKIDIGVRVGIVRGIDLTAEYSRHDAVVRDGVIHPDEALVTLRAGF